MAEFPDLGKQCEIQTCSRLDFLPFCCDYCSKTFCVEHKSVDAHECPNFKEAIASQCALGSKGESTHYTCHVTKCGVSFAVEMCCEMCNLLVCLEHRHPDQHACTSHNTPTHTPHMEKTNKLIKEIVDKNQSSKSASNSGVALSGTALKVRLMKLKMHANGDKGLPMEERVYADILLPSGTSKPFFFSKLWSVGKAIDTIAKMESLRNDNNRSDCERLMLAKDSHIFEDMSTKLHECVNSGDTLKLIYNSQSPS